MAETNLTAGAAAIAQPYADVDRLRRRYVSARSATAKARQEALTDNDYYHGEQLSPAVVKVLKQRNQPRTAFNRIGPTIDGILGVIEKGQSDPLALPRGQKDQAVSEIVTDALRFAADQSRWQRTKLGCARDLLVYGICAAVFEVNEEGDPWPARIHYADFFYDPHSREPDFKDARYLGVARWMFADDVAAQWPEVVEDAERPRGAVPTTKEQLNDLRSSVLDSFRGDISIGDDHEDKPADMTGVDPDARRILVVEMYHNDDGWKRCVFYAGGMLEAGDSPYVDDKGRPTCPIEASSAYIDNDNGRYGAVRRMRGPQDEINSRRIRLLFESLSRQLRQTDQAPEVSAAEAAKQAADPTGVIPVGYDIVPRGDVSQTQAALLQDSRSEIERQGPSPEVLGRQAASSSGRAQLIRQQAGLTELTPILGALEDFEHRGFRQMWSRIRQFKQAPWFVRITDDEGAPDFILANEPIMGPTPRPKVDPMTGQPVVNPWTGQPEIEVVEGVVGWKNRLAEMDVDIILDSTPDTASIQQEQFAQLVELAKIYGPQEVPFDDLMQISALPKKRELIEARKARREQDQPKGPNPLDVAKAHEMETRADLNTAKEFEIVRRVGGAGREAMQPDAGGAAPPAPGDPLASVGPASPPMGGQAPF